MNKLRFPLLMVLMAACAGCMVGPNYHRPTVAVPQSYSEGAGWMAATPADALPKGLWWTAFHDALLDQLEPLVAVSNPTVRQNYENYQQALAEVRVARSALFPTVGVSASVTRSGGSGAFGGTYGNATTTTATISPSPGSSSTSASTSSTAATRSGNSSAVNAAILEGNASWAPDLWGKVRRTIEENSATAQADEATLANATLSEQTLLAETLIELRFADAGIQLQQQTVEQFRHALQVVQAQGEAGITNAPPSAVIIAQVALESAQAQLTGLGVARAQFAHAIAVLVGKNPEDLPIPSSTVLPTLPPVPTGLPATLLQRRPDIAAAERAMAAQNAAIGVTVAAYYPSLALSGNAGFEASPLDGLLRAANYVWSLGASGSETVLDFGARRGAVQAARAAYQAAVANYRGTVLTAFQQVENDLAGLRILAAESQQPNGVVRDAIRGTQIALAEFEAGTVDYTTVATAQETQLADQQTSLGVQQNQLLSAVALIGDLGGGWSDAELHKP